MRDLKTLLIALLIFMQNEEIDGEQTAEGIPKPFWAYINTRWVVTKIFHGMCNTLSRMCAFDKLSWSERELIELYLADNVPTDLDNNRVNEAYWWLPVVREPRIQWLEEQIKMLK